MEKDDEIKGAGNSYTTYFRQNDPRIGRWLSQDPMADQRSWLNPYNFVQNNPINRIDPLGNVDDWVQGNGTDDKGNGENDWHWVDDVNTSEEAHNRGYKNYAAPGSVVEGHINGDQTNKVGSVYLGDKGKAGYIMDDVVVTANVPNDNRGGGSDNSSATFLNNLNTGIGALDVSQGAKGELISYAAKSSPAINDLKYVKGLKVLGGAKFVASTVISGGLATNYYMNGGTNSSVGIKASLDIIMGGVGFFGPIGFGVSATYFLLDASGAFGEYGDPLLTPKK